MAFVSTNSSDYLSAIAALKKPEYTSKYNETIEGIMDNIANRKEFQYDFNADPIYQNMKDSYTKLGKEAGMNAAAAVAANNGGFGNSYAATAASQANQQYLTKLNEQIPQLAEAALNKYQMETDNLYKKFGMYQSEENRLYGQHRDNVSDYYSDWSNLQNGMANAIAQENADRAFNYQVSRDQVADSQWQAQFDQNKYQNDLSYNQWLKQFNYNMNRDAVSDSQWQQEFDLKKKNAAKSGSGSSSASKQTSQLGSYGGSAVQLANEITKEFKATAEKNVSSNLSGSDYYGQLIDEYQKKYGFSDEVAEAIYEAYIPK